MKSSVLRILIMVGIIAMPVLHAMDIPMQEALDEIDKLKDAYEDDPTALDSKIPATLNRKLKDIQELADITDPGELKKFKEVYQKLFEALDKFYLFTFNHMIFEGLKDSFNNFRQKLNETNYQQDKGNFKEVLSIYRGYMIRYFVSHYFNTLIQDNLKALRSKKNFKAFNEALEKFMGEILPDQFLIFTGLVTSEDYNDMIQPLSLVRSEAEKMIGFDAAKFEQTPQQLQTLTKIPEEERNQYLSFAVLTILKEIFAKDDLDELKELYDEVEDLNDDKLKLLTGIEDFFTDGKSPLFLHLEEILGIIPEPTPSAPKPEPGSKKDFNKAYQSAQGVIAILKDLMDEVATEEMTLKELNTNLKDDEWHEAFDQVLKVMLKTIDITNDIHIDNLRGIYIDLFTELDDINDFSFKANFFDQLKDSFKAFEKKLKKGVPTTEEDVMDNFQAMFEMYAGYTTRYYLEKYLELLNKDDVASLKKQENYTKFKKDTEKLANDLLRQDLITSLPNDAAVKATATKIETDMGIIDGNVQRLIGLQAAPWPQLFTNFDPFLRQAYLNLVEKALTILILTQDKKDQKKELAKLVPELQDLNTTIQQAATTKPALKEFLINGHIPLLDFIQPAPPKPAVKPMTSQEISRLLNELSVELSVLHVQVK